MVIGKRNISEQESALNRLRQLTSDVTIFAGFKTSSEKLHIWVENEKNSFVEIDTAGVYESGTGVLRDPSIIKFGGYYYIAHTDGMTGTTFRVIRSRDLLNWEAVTIVDCSGVAGTVYSTWAPELYVDGDTVYAFVSLSTDGGTTKQIYETHSTDMASWTTPVIITVTGKSNVIDAFIVKKDDTYYMFYKDESTNYIEIATSSTLTGTYTPVKTGNFAGWSNPREGVSVLKKGDNYIAYFDAYSDGQYYVSESTDLDTWSSPVEVSFENDQRHGTPLLIATYDLLATARSLLRNKGTQTITDGNLVLSRGSVTLELIMGLTTNGIKTHDANFYITRTGVAGGDIMVFRSSNLNIAEFLGRIRHTSLATYADNASAISGGLIAGDFYQTATGELRIVV